MSATGARSTIAAGGSRVRAIRSGEFVMARDRRPRGNPRQQPRAPGLLPPVQDRGRNDESRERWIPYCRVPVAVKLPLASDPDANLVLCPRNSPVPGTQCLGVIARVTVTPIAIPISNIQPLLDR